MKRTSPRVASTECSERTQRRRAREVQECRANISGGAPEILLQREIGTLSREERQDLLKKAGVTLEIPAGQGLAMKADLALPWNKLRDVRRYHCQPACVYSHTYTRTHARTHTHTHTHNVPETCQVAEGIWSGVG